MQRDLLSYHRVTPLSKDERELFEVRLSRIQSCDQQYLARIVSALLEIHRRTLLNNTRIIKISLSIIPLKQDVDCLQCHA